MAYAASGVKGCRKASLKHGWSAISHDLAEKFAEMQMSQKAMALAILVARKSFGNGRQASGIVETAWLAEKLGIKVPSVCRIIRILVAGEILKEYAPPRRLRAGERCLGIQFEDIEVWDWKDASEKERNREMPLFAKNPPGQTARTHRGKPAEPTGANGANPPGQNDRHKSEPSSTYDFARKGRKKVPEEGRREETAADARARAMVPRPCPVPPPAEVQPAAAVFSTIQSLTPEDARDLSAEASAVFGCDGALAFAKYCAAELEVGSVDNPRIWIGSAIGRRIARPHAKRDPNRAASAEKARIAADNARFAAANRAILSKNLKPKTKIRLVGGPNVGVVLEYEQYPRCGRPGEWTVAGRRTGKYQGPGVIDLERELAMNDLPVDAIEVLA